MSPIIINIIALVGFFVLVAINMPIGFAFAIVGFIGVILLKGMPSALILLGTTPFQWASMSSLIVMPLFILMGQLAFYSGISTDLFNAAHKWAGRLPGGMALATMLACTGFAACTGSSLASGSTMATVAYPEMERLNYSKRLSTGVVAAGGTLGILIPPSFMFVVYGGLTETSIGKLFIAGIFPGLLLSGLFLITIFVMCKLNPRMGPPSKTVYSLGDKIKSLSGIWGMLILFVLVIGGLYAGVFAPSEAGSIGALGSFFIAVGRRKLSIKNFLGSLKSTAQSTSMILTITIGAMVFNFLVSVSGFATMMSTWIKALAVSPYVILSIVIIMYVILGMVMDSLAAILLTLPIVYPVILGLGFDPIWFGVIIVIMVELAMITPPVGIMSYVISGMTKVPLSDVFLGITPFAVAMLAGVALLVAYPQIALYLPSLM